MFLVHSFLYQSNKLPEIFRDYFPINYTVHNYNTRVNKDLHLSRVNTTFGQRYVRYKAALFWNKLPKELKEQEAQRTFKSYIQHCNAFAKHPKRTHLPYFY